MPVKIRDNGQWVTVSDGTNGAAGADGGFPSGTRMLFNQTTAPVGWTKQTTAGNATTNNRALRLVDGTVGAGGDYNFTARFNSIIQTTEGSVSGHILSTAETASHFHNYPGDDQLTNANNLASWTNASDANFNYDAVSNLSGGAKLWRTTTKLSQQTTGDQSHGHGFTNPKFNLGVKYTDVMIAQKD